MIVTKTIGQISWRIEGAAQEIVEYEQLQEQKILAFKHAIHVKTDAEINKDELIEELKKGTLKITGPSGTL